MEEPPCVTQAAELLGKSHLRVLGLDPRDDFSRPGVGSDAADRLDNGVTGHSPPDETSRWVAALSDTLRKRLVAVGLIEAPEPEPGSEQKLTLGVFLDGYMESRADIKETTRIALGQTVRYLKEFFGVDKPLEDITPGDADEWRDHLKGQLGLADNTVRRRSGVARQFFRAAVRKRLLAENPFAGIKVAVRGNPAREYFVTRDEAQKVLDACPDAEWRLIFALCRYGGLRCPSEILKLTWRDIRWDEGRFTVHSPKTEHHEGHASREVPLFPELLPYLREAFEQAQPGTEYVIIRYRRSNQNLQMQLRRFLKRAGLKPWPKLYQNLRSTCQTELADRFPMHVVCAWIGNSQPVAMKHYLQVTDDHFRLAADGKKAVQNPVQSGAAEACAEAQGKTDENVKSLSCNVLQDSASRGDSTHGDMVGATGLEPVASWV